MSHDGNGKVARGRRPRAVAVATAAVVVLLALAGAAAVWQWYVAAPRRDMDEAHALLDATVKRRLTDDEFDRVIALLDSATEAARLSAVVTLDRAAHRSPSRRDRAVAALEACRQAGSPAVREVAALTLTAMRDSPGLRDEAVLSDAALTRGLTDVEFDRALGLLKADTEATRLSAILTLEVAAGRNPDRRGRTVEALEACRRAAGSPAVRDAAGRAADRLKGPPPAPPNPAPLSG